MLSQTPFDARHPTFVLRYAIAALLLCAGGLLLTPAANAQQNTPSPLAGEGRGEGNLINFDIPAQDLSDALSDFARQSGQDLLYKPEQASGRAAGAVEGSMTRTEAIRQLLAGTGLQFEYHDTGSMLIGDEATLEAYRRQLNSGAAIAGQNTVGQRRKGIEEIIVTGQKKEERIQDVPIAISAFTQEDLTTSQIAGGPDLHLQVPNMTFTKTNFTGYSIQIRGIGTQAISATTDPAVAVALNNSPFITNRFFEQEFFDMERVEVLRGPQGTLYGRNATAGVVNLITAKPKFQQESMLSYDKGNYESRRWEFMINQPLVDDRMAFRLAGAGTKRDGYAINELTNTPIDGRDLWSTRASLRFAPNDRLDMILLWEHFEEEDDRLRSGKQLCKTDIVERVGNVPVESQRQRLIDGGLQAPWVTVAPFHSTGCERVSLYSKEAFQTPNGPSMPFYLPLGAIGGQPTFFDPYASANQSRDLRAIQSTVDPRYRAKSDIGQLQIDFEINDSLTFESETAYSVDEVWSTQDFNRFNTVPGAFCTRGRSPATKLCFPEGTEPPSDGVVARGILDEDGVFCDPQIGCSDRVTLVDLSTGESTQFNQEFRLSSNFTGPFNFSVGVNFTRFDYMAKYYVFINHLTLTTVNTGSSLSDPWDPNNPTPRNEKCNGQLSVPSDPTRVHGFGCVYTEANSIDNIQDQGHNYFLSKNPYRLISYATFGETYWNITDALKLTAGLRWSVDEKTAPVIPSWTLAGSSRGYPVLEVIEQEWREPTGRLVLDWKPMLGFTDETLIYGSISRGYKAGGANPPPYVGINTIIESTLLRPKTFAAEFVNAFEVGTKNTLADGAVTFNFAAFYYDYKDYQISEIVDRSAFNRNYDAEVWGAEIEADWWVRENLRLGFKGGYQKTRIADGEEAIDLMDRTAGNELWTVVRPFPTYPSSCILPVALFTHNGLLPQAPGEDPIDLGQNNGGTIFNMGEAASNTAGTGCEFAYRDIEDPITRQPYEPPPPGGYPVGLGQTFLWSIDYPGWNPEWAPNNGEGIAKDLGGNELPNAPNYTVTLLGDYIIPLGGDWMMTAHTDIYWQSESWWRVFNDHEFSRLDDYFTMNLAAIFRNEVSGWNVMAYIKNVTDETAITGAFLNSDDTGLTTNVFLVEPRLVGIRATKRWGDGEGPSQWLGAGTAALLGKEPGEPTPFSLTLGGQMLRPKEAGNEPAGPPFVTNFDPNIDPTREQGEKLDWGDGREIVLTYAPKNGWRFSLGARSGESSREFANKFSLGEEVKGCRGEAYTCSGGGNYVYRTNYSIVDLAETEEHLLIDFMVGRDVGLGLDEVVESTLSAGLRYAHFQSRTDTRIEGTPDWQIADECATYYGCFVKYGFDFIYTPNPSQHHEYAGPMKVRREFEGVGPVVEWDASMRLLGDARGGHLDLDWELSGGVLFGRQTARVRGAYEVAYYNGTLDRPEDSLVSEETVSFSYERSTESTVVPTLGAGLGLTYRIEGGSISAGYNWERYYSVIDGGGLDERKSLDRTIDGPYLKVTFGGGS